MRARPRSCRSLRWHRAGQVWRSRRGARRTLYWYRGQASDARSVYWSSRSSVTSIWCRSAHAIFDPYIVAPLGLLG
jgi:hypothetical protein